MKQVNLKGRKHRLSFRRRGAAKAKRFLSLVLCSSMIGTGMANTTVLASAAAEQKSQAFEMKPEALSEALLKAAASGKAVKEDAFSFDGEEKDSYEALFQSEGDLYELHPEMEREDGKLRLRVFARLDGEPDMDSYQISGKEEILFLLSNASAKEQAGRVVIGNQKSPVITVLPVSDLKEEVLPVETQAPETVEPVQQTEESVPEEEKNDKSGTESAETENDAEQNSEQETIERAEEAVSEAGSDASDLDPGENEERSEDTQDKEEAANPDAGKEEKVLTDADESEKEDDAQKGNEPGVDQADADNTHPDEDKAEEKENSGELSLSRSEHFRWFLTSAAPASASELSEDEEEEAEKDVSEENGEILTGDVYESVLMGNRAAAVFVTTAEELGLFGMNGENVYTAETEHAWITVTALPDTFEEEVVLEAEEVAPESEPYEELQSRVQENGYQPLSFSAFDLKFRSASSREEIEPQKEVQVQIQWKQAEKPESETAVRVLHLHEEALTEISPASANSDEITFETDTFSVFLMLTEKAEGAARIGSQAYDTLLEAFAAVQTGETIEVLRDCELNESVIVSGAVVLELGGHTVSVKVEPADSQTKSAFIVPAEGILTIQNGKILGNESLDNRALEAEAGSQVCLNKVTWAGFSAKNGNGGIVWMENGILEASGCSFGYYDKNADVKYGRNSARNGGAIYADNSQVTIKDSNLFYNDGTQPEKRSNEEISYLGGGALYLSGDGTNAEIEDCYFFGNSTRAMGGSIHLDQVGTAELKNNRIFSSTAWGGYGKEEGGGIYVRICRDVKLIGNTIRRCETMTNGGGLSVVAGNGHSIYLEENEISECQASGRGGGMRLLMTKGSSLQLVSGKILNNQARTFGGGIDYTGHDMIPMELKNVVVTENTAVRGAGIWACPTSETEVYSTLGGAFYGNQASGTISSLNGTYGATGDEIRYEGVDTPDKFVANSGMGISQTTRMNVSKRAPGGGVMHWYQDEENARYQSGDAEAAQELYTDTNLSFGLHGELSEEHQMLAAEDAQILIQGNSAQRGGGIAANSPLIIGLRSADVSVEVTKQWGSEEHPDHVLVDLYRVSADGSEHVKLDRDVELNETNGWSASFTDLPSKYVSGGEVKECVYEVKEQAVSGWKSSQLSEYDADGRIYHITLQNDPVHYGSLKVSKEVTGNGDKEQRFTFTVRLSGTEMFNGQYGGMKFEDNAAIFTLKHGESLTAEGIPEGTAYTVEESDNEGYTVTKSGDEGVISAGLSEAKFINYKGNEPDETKPSVPETKPSESETQPSTEHRGGGSHGGGGHSGGSSSRTTTAAATEPSVEPTEPVQEIVEIPIEAPQEELPKTGDTTSPENALLLLAAGMTAAAYVLLHANRKED